MYGVTIPAGDARRDPVGDPFGIIENYRPNLISSLLLIYYSPNLFILLLIYYWPNLISILLLMDYSPNGF